MKFQVIYDIHAVVVLANKKQRLAYTNFRWIDYRLLTSVQVTEFHRGTSLSNLGLSDVEHGVRRLCTEEHLKLML